MKIARLPSTILLSWVLILGSGTVSAFEQIPKESGFSGFINLGAAYIETESNMVAGLEIVDLGNDTINSIFDDPDSKSDVLPLVNLDLHYTFATTRTQLFIGNSLEDFVRFDLTAQAGVRQELPDSSTVAASFVFSGLPTEVWEDPYVVGVPRNETDRTSNGVRLRWDNLLDTSAGVTYTYRKIELDDELSGLTQLGLSAAQAALLDREGDHHEVELLYEWKVAERHTLIPAFRYNKFDLDGDAMANDRYSLQLTYKYRGEQFSVAANGSVALADYDATNPIYNTKRDDTIYGGTLQVFWHRPFGAPKGVSLLGIVGFFKTNADIDFYDAQTFLLGLSAFYRF